MILGTRYPAKLGGQSQIIINVVDPIPDHLPTPRPRKQCYLLKISYTEARKISKKFLGVVITKVAKCRIERWELRGRLGLR